TVPRGAVLRRGIRANPLLVAGAAGSALILLVALLAPLLAPFPGDAGTATHPLLVLRPPSAQHWFGTDNVGRDVYSRVLYGARIPPLIAVMGLLIAPALGIPRGVMAGYFGGWLDEVIMRVTDIFLAFPPLLLALAFAAVLPASLTTVIIAIAITWWPWYTRLIRGQAASVAGRPYIEACRALGISRWRILVRQLPWADPGPAFPAQLDHAAARADLVRRRRGHPDRLGAVVPRPRRAGPDSGLGPDGGRGPGVLHHRLVGGDLPRPGDPVYRVHL